MKRFKHVSNGKNSLIQIICDTNFYVAIVANHLKTYIWAEVRNCIVLFHVKLLLVY